MVAGWGHPPPTSGRPGMTSKKYLPTQTTESSEPPDANPCMQCSWRSVYQRYLSQQHPSRGAFRQGFGDSVQYSPQALAPFFLSKADLKTARAQLKRKLLCAMGPDFCPGWLPRPRGCRLGVALGAAECRGHRPLAPAPFRSDAFPKPGGRGASL